MELLGKFLVLFYAIACFLQQDKWMDTWVISNALQQQQQ